MEGLEPTLIRNLSDHMGNNLLHTICYNGHAHILPWLTGRFGGDLADGLKDENRNGTTPALAAIKVTSKVQFSLLNIFSGNAKGNSLTQNCRSTP